MIDPTSPLGHALTCAKWQMSIQSGKRALVLDPHTPCTCASAATEEEQNPDFITLLPTVNPNMRLVVVMRYNKMDDSYTPQKYSQPLNERNAKALAESWSQALKLEVR